MSIHWFGLSLIGLGALSGMSLIIAHLIRQGLSTGLVLFVVAGGLAITSLIVFLSGANRSLPDGATPWVLLVLAGLLSAVGNFVAYQAAAVAPNAGLPIVVAGLQGAAVVVLSILLLKDSINTLQLVGVLFAITAVALIGFGSRA